jgi:hypothetical protein
MAATLRTASSCSWSWISCGSLITALLPGPQRITGCPRGLEEAESLTGVLEATVQDP